MRKSLVFILGIWMFGCGARGTLSNQETIERIRCAHHIPAERFWLKAKPEENIAETCLRKGFFSAVVSREGARYWLSVRNAMGTGESIREEIFEVKGDSLVGAGSDIRVGYSGGGLLREPNTVLDEWYSLHFGLRVIGSSRLLPDELRFRTHLMDLPWVPGPQLVEAKVQQVVMANLMPRILAFHPDVQLYELTLYHSRAEVYLLECWRDSEGDWFLGYRFDRSVGRDGMFAPDAKLRFDGIRLRREWWRRPKPWMSVVKWKRG